MSDIYKENYDVIWNCTILPEINRYKDTVVAVSCKNTMEIDIRNSYQRFKNHCKTRYMLDPEKRLDRHKVAACYMFAILESEPLSLNIECDDDVLITINEHLAITVGLTILNAFLHAKKAEDMDDTDISELKEQYFLNEKDLDLPSTPQGDYRDIFAAELYFTRKEKSYNILSLSKYIIFIGRI